MKNKQQIVFRNGDSFSDLSKIVDQYSVCTVTIEEGEPKKRSLDANALQHVWYKEISEHTGMSIPDISAYCKLELGLPIIRYDSRSENEKDTADYINWTLEKIGFDDRLYDQKIKIIKKMPVTRILSTRQHYEYRKQMQAEYAPGLILEVR